MPRHHQSSRSARALLVLSGLVCLIGLSNLTILLLARAEARAAELAIRLLAGASRRRIFQLFTTEGAVLGTAGGGLGMGVAWLLLTVGGALPSVEMKFTLLRYQTAPTHILCVRAAVVVIMRS